MSEPLERHHVPPTHRGSCSHQLADVPTEGRPAGVGHTPGCARTTPLEERGPGRLSSSKGTLRTRGLGAHSAGTHLALGKDGSCLPAILGPLGPPDSAPLFSLLARLSLQLTKQGSCLFCRVSAFWSPSECDPLHEYLSCPPRRCPTRGRHLENPHSQ